MGVPVTVTVKLVVPPADTLMLLGEALICGAACVPETDEIFAVTEALAEPAALVAVHPIVACPPAGTVLGAL